jgi:hypothetical protein
MPASKAVSDYFQSTCPRRNGKFQLKALKIDTLLLKEYAVFEKCFLKETYEKKQISQDPKSQTAA